MKNRKNEKIEKKYIQKLREMRQSLKLRLPLALLVVHHLRCHRHPRLVYACSGDMNPEEPHLLR